jgi:hypothetical protein
MYSQPINLNTDDEYLMGKEKEPEKEDEELKKVSAPVSLPCTAFLRYSWGAFGAARMCPMGSIELVMVRACARW